MLMSCLDEVMSRMCKWFYQGSNAICAHRMFSLSEAAWRAALLGALAGPERAPPCAPCGGSGGPNPVAQHAPPPAAAGCPALRLASPSPACAANHCAVVRRPTCSHITLP